MVGSRAAGISHLIVNANVERQLWNGWSVAAALSYSGERWADTWAAPTGLLSPIAPRRVRAMVFITFGPEG